jgi:hypothetical protein
LQVPKLVLEEGDLVALWQRLDELEDERRLASAQEAREDRHGDVSLRARLAYCRCRHGPLVESQCIGIFILNLVVINARLRVSSCIVLLGDQ